MAAQPEKRPVTLSKAQRVARIKRRRHARKVVARLLNIRRRCETCLRWLEMGEAGLIEKKGLAAVLGVRAPSPGELADARGLLRRALLIVGELAGDRVVRRALGRVGVPLVCLGDPIALAAARRETALDQLAALPDRELIARVMGSCDHLTELNGGLRGRHAGAAGLGPGQTNADLDTLGVTGLDLGQIRPPVFAYAAPPTPTSGTNAHEKGEAA